MFLPVRVATGVDAEFPYRVRIVDRGVDCRDPVCRHHFRFLENCHCNRLRRFISSLRSLPGAECLLALPAYSSISSAFPALAHDPCHVNNPFQNTSTPLQANADILHEPSLTDLMLISAAACWTLLHVPKYSISENSRRLWLFLGSL